MWLWQYLKSFGDNFGKVDSWLYRGANISSKDDYQKLQKLGVRTIVNLIYDNVSEARFIALANGFNFVHIPMKDDATPDKDDIREFLNTVRNQENSPTFVHCKGGRHRTSLVVAVYRVLYNGWSKKQAWKEAEKFGWYGALGHEPLKDYFFETNLDGLR